MPVGAFYGARHVRRPAVAQSPVARNRARDVGLFSLFLAGTLACVIAWLTPLVAALRTVINSAYCGVQ